MRPRLGHSVQLQTVSKEARMTTVRLVLLAFAVVLFLLAGCNVSHPRVSFGWLGLALLTIALWLLR